MAVKILPVAAGTEQDAVARFRREAEIAASLSHPGITTVFDIEEHVEETGRTLLFLVMELMQGRDLVSVIAQHPGGLPIEQTAEFSRQILEALAAAHEQGVTHRDIKPRNLFLLANGRVKVCDFGIARLADATRITSTGSVAGTPLYMAPEQIQGRPTDQRTDLYAFGCVLYELLTGSGWVDTGSGVASLLYQHISRPPAPPRSRRPEIPEHLDRLVLDLLAKEPADRPADAAAALARLSAGVAEGGAAVTVPLRVEPASSVRVDPPRTALDVAWPTSQPAPAPSPTAVARPRRTWSTTTVTGTAVVLGTAAAITLAIATNGAGSDGEPNSSIFPLHKDETPSGVVLAQSDMARIPFIYDTSSDSNHPAYSRITLGITLTSITPDPGPATPAISYRDANGVSAPTTTAGYDTYCVRFRVTNLNSTEMPAQLPTDNSFMSNTDPHNTFSMGLARVDHQVEVQGKPALLLEGVLSDGTLTNEQHTAFDTSTCHPNDPGTVAPGQSFDQGALVLVPSGKHLTVVGAQWTEPTSVVLPFGPDTKTYSVQWKRT